MTRSPIELFWTAKNINRSSPDNGLVSPGLKRSLFLQNMIVPTASEMKIAGPDRRQVTDRFEERTKKCFLQNEEFCYIIALFIYLCQLVVVVSFFSQKWQKLIFMCIKKYWG